MNTGNNSTKQKEKILIGSIAATALGLVNAKPQIAKAAYNGNSNLATKKANRKTIKTKINYKTAHNPRAEKTEFLQAQAAEESAPEAHNAESQNFDDTDNDLTNQNVNSTPNNNDPSLASSNQINNTEDKSKSTVKQDMNSGKFRPEEATKTTTNSGKWRNIPFTYESGGTLTLGDGQEYTTSPFGSPLSQASFDDGNYTHLPAHSVRYLKILGKIKVTHDIDNFVGDFISLKSIEGINNLGLNQVQSAKGMFEGCGSLTSISGFDELDFSHVTDVSKMFSGCSSLTSLPGFDKLNFSNVTNTSFMFYICYGLEKLILPKTFKKPIRDSSYMFSGCTRLNYLDISGLNMSKISTLTGMLGDSPDHNGNLTSLNTLVLGPTNVLSKGEKNNVGLVVPGTWINMGVDYSDTYPLQKGTYSWNSADLMKNYQGDTEHDTYQRFTGGPITIHYLDESDKTTKIIADKVINDGNIDEPFDVTKYTALPDELNKKYTFDKDNSTNLTEQFSDKPQEVNLYYKKKVAGTVTIHYVDKSHPNDPITNDITLPNGNIGDPFNVINYGDKNTDYTVLPDELNKKYTFDKEDSKNLQGKFSTEPQDVTLVYTRNEGKKITIHYQDESGKKIAPDRDYASGYYGDPFDASASEYSDLTGYTLDKSKSTNVSGTFTDKPQEVTLVYTRNEGKTITIHYHDESGKTIAPDRDYASGYYGDPFDASASEYSNLTGYTLDKSKSTNVSGTFTDKPQEVTLVYTRNEGKTITIHYHDESGKTIAPDRDYASGYYGDPFDASAPEYSNLTGYTLDKSKSTNVSGTFTNKPQEVTLVYTKNPDNSHTTGKVKAAAITVHYQDEYGNTLAPDKVLNGYVGDGYTTGAEQVSGYTLKTRPENATGFFNTFPQSVIYIYSKKENNAGTNTITPDDNKPTAIPVGKKPKKKIVKNNNKNMSKNKGSKQKTHKPVTNRKSNYTTKMNKNIKTMPKTGTNKYSNLAMFTLGGLALIGALGAAWLDRRKNE
ncbi:MucBP domain-containing protein [Lactobacillus sp. ESL0261]|uniref:MucBP domain-containing protein n=1 Tax=Lactobacillus sp. ESL0261 TaxID=2069348 RepID=UPI000EFAE30C|nr:MucBP domain-containing protein [Lactobacillus sp. ESL0261]RMC52948.1 BspA family leucine-rich repeat surface protein [Lactobacillus sp. ESL0261]